MHQSLPAVEKLTDAHVENAPSNADDEKQEYLVREFDPAFMRKTTLKVSAVVVEVRYAAADSL